MYVCDSNDDDDDDDAKTPSWASQASIILLQTPSHKTANTF